MAEIRKRIQDQMVLIEAQLSRPQPRRTSASAAEPLGGDAGDRQIRTDGRQSPIVRQSFNASVPRRYGDMFASNPGRDQRGNQFSTFGEFARAVASGSDPRLMVRASMNPMTTGEGASAGFMVPTAFAQQLLDAALLQEVFRPRANVIPIVSGTTVIAGFDGIDRIVRPACRPHDALGCRVAADGAAEGKGSPHDRERPQGERVLRG